MISALKQFGLTRWLALLVFGSVLIGCMVGFHRGWSSDGYRVPGALDISGEWEFYNGKLTPAEAQTKPFPFKVQVPKPLPAEIREKLAEEFWYRKSFGFEKVRESSWSISFGTIKGEHVVYWNGRFLGSGGKTGLAMYRIPTEYLEDKNVVVSIKIARSETLFPGIVNLLSVVLGNSSIIDEHRTLYYSEAGVKPILSGVIKLLFALLFASLFLVTPQKREYFPFALFSLLSALSAVSASKFLPLYDDFYLRSATQFILGVIALAMLPFVTSAFLRFSEAHRSYARGFGFAAPLIFILAATIVHSKEEQLAVYRMANEWLPLLVGIPSVIACVWCFFKLDRKLVHRKRQIFVFALSLLLGALTWGGSAASFYKFQLVKFSDYIDSLIFLGLSIALVMDFRTIVNRSERAGKSVPKWFAGFLAAGTKAVQFEIAMVVIAVDTIAYTKKLSDLSVKDKDLLHKEIRDSLQPLVASFRAQKLSDGGDGGLFAWDIPNQEIDWKDITAAVQYISQVLGPRFGVRFRVGMAAGNVRCEMRESDFSFMGEALNTAARLESMSKSGEPLLDESVAVLLPAYCSDILVESELKGVVYRGRVLKIAA